MQVMIRVHFFLVLLLLGSLPFTFLRHVAGATLNVYYRRRERPAQLRPAYGEGYLGAGRIEDFSWKQLLEAEACVSCGRCEKNCPATISGKTLSPKVIMQGILHQMEARGPSRLLEDEIPAEDIWSCTTCMACVEHCPVFVEPVDKILDMRRYLVTGKAMLPVEARPMIRNVEIFGDVHGRGPARRADWALHRDVPPISATGQEVLLWVGCAGAFHPRSQETVRAMVKVLKAAGVRFGILGKQESCCGDPARRLGDERLFQDLAGRNIERMSRYAFHEILVLCPHCFNTLKNEYPALGGSFPVVHSAEFIVRLIQDQRITLKYPLPATLTIHDPCYLGRGNGIYEPLRDISRHVPGAHLKELTRNREKGFCCGAGGGRMWLHETGGRRINQVRAEEIRDSAVDMVATACPYCLTMMEDGIGSLELLRPPKVRDMVEIVAHAMGC